MELNERIIQARKQAGLTQEQLGEKLGVSRQAVSKWESGQANPDVSYVMEMCHLFGVTADYLLFGTPAGQAEPAADPAPEQAEPACSTYSLYLNHNDEFSWSVARLVSSLFQNDWAHPAFEWDGSRIGYNEALQIIGGAPMVLCSGLTRRQAEQGAAIFADYPALVRIYPDSDLEDGVPLHPEGETYTPPVREPLSGFAIFGLVVLGVIVAIVLMSFF